MPDRTAAVADSLTGFGYHFGWWVDAEGRHEYCHPLTDCYALHEAPDSETP